MFKTVPRDKISLNIVRQMREAILDGKLQPGDQLPPESELLTQFGVSKHTLREALRALESMGFIQIRKGAGGGPTVMEIDMETARDSIANFLHFKNVSIHDLSEARRIFEPYLARLAAEHLAKEDLEKLKRMNDSLEAAIGRGEDITGGKDEIDFHVTLAEASGNPVLVLILNFVNSLLIDIKLRLEPGLDFSRQVYESHVKLYQAIVAGDGKAAADAMYEHVCQVEEGLEELQIRKDAEESPELSDISLEGGELKAP